jgi:polysaccharide biosynthesis PFTS motif protein
MKILEYFPIIKKYIDRRNRSKLRLIRRGYKQLHNNNRLGLILQLRDFLSKTKLKSVKIHTIFFGKNSLNIELSVRQYLTVKILSMSFNKEVLYSLGAKKPIRYPLPREWRIALTIKKIQVDNFSCALLWYGYVTLFWGHGVLHWLKSFWSISYKRQDLGNYIYFHDLDKNNISHNVKDHNIVNWYLQWKNKSKDINSACHSVKGLSNFKLNGLKIVNTDGLPKLKGREIIYYYIYSIYLIMYSFIVILIRPYYSLMLFENIKLVRTSLADKDQLASDYLFHNSAPFYRPMWTYELQRKGSRVLFYFYSTNNEKYKTKDGFQVQNTWHLISWPYYLVWDQYQSDLVKRFAHGNPIVEDVGPIWFSSNDVEISVPLNSIAVFDITPYRVSRYIILGAQTEFIVPRAVNQFLNDIQKVLAQNNFTMMHKMKRINPNAHKKYNYNIRTLRERSNYQQIHPDLDATQLIQKAAATISMPFTSTALIARHEGKPSVYYDPIGIIQVDDRAAHGIPILVSIDELQEWVEGIN